MIPKSVLNELRRQAIAALQRAHQKEQQRRTNPKALDELRSEYLQTRQLC